jgi:putative transposase
VVDEFTREGLAIRCGRSLTGTDVMHTLNVLIKRSGRPMCLKSDNGPQFIATAVREWLEERYIASQYIAPGSPWQSACQSEQHLSYDLLEPLGI